MGEFRFMRRRPSLPLYLGQALEVVVARVDAESSLVVLQFVGSVKVEVALVAFVRQGLAFGKHKL